MVRRICCKCSRLTHRYLTVIGLKCDQEDPYKMSLFGKSASHMEVVASEFLPQDKQLNILVADSDKNIHVLQYDPESRLIRLLLFESSS